MLRLSYVLAVLPLLSIFSFAACNPDTAFQVVEHSLTVSEYTADLTQSTATVKGLAKNTGNWPVEYGGVSVTYYDYQGNKLVVLSESRQRLEPGEAWEFKVELKGPAAWKVAKYAIATFHK